MSLEQWRRNGWLLAAETKLPEITQLFAVADREIHDARVDGVSDDGRFMHAYDAALTLCTIALRVAGYQVAKGSGHHKRTIDALPFAVGAEHSALADQIELASRLRGQAMYDRTGVAGEQSAAELLEVATELRAIIIAWIKQTHRELLPTPVE